MDENDPLDGILGRNQNFQKNHILISDAYWEHIKESSRFPTVEELSAKTGLGVDCIRDHIGEISKKHIRDRIEGVQLMSEMVLMGLAKKAISGDKGSENAAKTYFQLIEDFEEKKTVTVNDVRQMSDEEIDYKLAEYNKILNGKLVKFNGNTTESLGSKDRANGTDL